MPSSSRHRFDRNLGSAAAAAVFIAGLAAFQLACTAPESDGTTADRRTSILAPTDSFDRSEAYEALQGGSATNRERFDHDAFSQPSANLSFAERSDFFVGNGLFRRLWVTAPASTRAADGLGPLFNARSCQLCHLKDGRGHPPESELDSAVSMILKLSVPPRTDEERRDLAARSVTAIPEPIYGGQLQDVAVAGIAPEGRLRVTYEEVPFELADGERVSLRRPSYAIEDLAYGALAPDLMTSPRVASPMIGLGLLEAVDEADLLAAEDPEDSDGDGISGRANRVWSRLEQRVALGRFGWKAAAASIADQTANAMIGDLGLSNPLIPAHWGDCTAAQTECRSAPHGNSSQYEDLEIHGELMDFVVFYSRHLAVPARRDLDNPRVLTGKRIFYETGCATCHRPKLATRSDWPEEALAAQLIWPYTDLLLHDMGEDLSDGRPEGVADGREWRTTPLWGLGLTETVNGHTLFLHDGRARNLTEAILWHGGEAEASRDAFAQLRAEDRGAMLAFLNSL